MAIVYCLDAQGGFTAGDTETGVTAYAYPTSTHATNAKKNEKTRKQVANEMIKQQNTQYRGYAHIVKENDARNWARINPV